MLMLVLLCSYPYAYACAKAFSLLLFLANFPCREENITVGGGIVRLKPETAINLSFEVPTCQKHHSFICIIYITG